MSFLALEFLILMNIYQFVVSIDMTACLLTSYEQITEFLSIESNSESLVLFQMWWFVCILGMSFNVFREMNFWRRCHVVFIALNCMGWQLIWLMRPELQFYPRCSNSFSNPCVVPVMFWALCRVWETGSNHTNIIHCLK